MSERKLTDKDVEDIRKSNKTQAALARQYGVRLKLISEIKKGWDYRIPEERPAPQPKRVVKGISNSGRKLSPEQVRLVRKELLLKRHNRKGKTLQEIAKMVGVSEKAIKDIRDGITYRDVK